MQLCKQLLQSVLSEKVAALAQVKGASGAVSTTAPPVPPTVTTGAVASAASSLSSSSVCELSCKYTEIALAYTEVLQLQVTIFIGFFLSY